MTRIPSHSIETAPAPARPLIEALANRALQTGQLLNFQAQMAHAPVVLGSYVAIRKALEELGTFELTLRSAIMVTVAQVQASAYALALNVVLARRAGWTDAHTFALRDGRPLGDAKIDALLAVVRDAAGDGGRVRDATWRSAVAAGWTDAQLAETYAYVGIAMYVDAFMHYAESAIDPVLVAVAA